MSRRESLRRRPALRTLACVLLAASLSAPARAERNPLEARLILDAGWFFLASDTRVRVDGETTDTTGTDVDFDSTFGLGDSDRFRADLLWRIGGRHALRAMYFENDRSATRRITRTIEFGDTTFPVDAEVSAHSELTVAQLSYEYAFWRGESHDVAASIGIHMLDTGFHLRATVTAQGETGSRTIGDEATTEAPLPVIGLRGLWRLPWNLYATAQAQYFRVEIDPYSGSLLDLKATLVWQASDRLGIGVGYNDFGFRFDIDDEGDFSGRLRWEYDGALAFVTFLF